MTTAVHCRKESYDVMIDRSTIFGNPFIIGRDGTRSEVLQKYREWIADQPDLLEEIKKLRGLRLGCWCKPKSCHGDIIAEIADRYHGGLYACI